MDIDSLYVKKTNGNNTKTFRIKSEFKIDCIDILILHESAAYKAKVDFNEINNFAINFEIETNIYRDTLKSYLSQDLVGINVDILNKQFIIYKHGKIKYFYTKIEEIDNAGIVGDLLDESYQSIAGFKKEIIELKNKNIISKNERNDARLKLEEYIEADQSREKQLISGFIIMLNEKKRRIQFLTELLEANQEETNAPKRTLTTISKKRSKKIKLDEKVAKIVTKEVISDSGTDTEAGYNTDDEEEICTKDVPVAIAEASSMDLFIDDSPPPPSLPQRIKRNCVISQAATTSKFIQPSENSMKESQAATVSNFLQFSENSMKESEENVEIKSDTPEHSPTIDFSTQNLLDRM